MIRRQADSNSLVLYKSANLERLNTSVEVTEKLLYERAEFFFNKGFVLLNSSISVHPSVNFSREISSSRNRKPFRKKNNSKPKSSTFASASGKLNRKSVQ